MRRNICDLSALFDYDSTCPKLVYLNSRPPRLTVLYKLDICPWPMVEIQKPRAWKEHGWMGYIGRKFSCIRGMYFRLRSFRADYSKYKSHSISEIRLLKWWKTANPSRISSRAHKMAWPVTRLKVAALHRVSNRISGMRFDLYKTSLKMRLKCFE